MSDEQGGGFLDRWSRRKVQARAGQAPADEAPPPVAAAVAAPVDGSKKPPALADQAPPAIKEEAPVLTLEDAQALTPESDFTPFVQRAVAPEVRNAAFKKLFADPHFNVMDGLDIYIDDYSQPDPLPASMLRQMASAKFLQLVEEEPEAPPTDRPITGLTPQVHSGLPGFSMSSCEPKSPMRALPMLSGRMQLQQMSVMGLGNLPVQVVALAAAPPAARASPDSHRSKEVNQGRFIASPPFRRCAAACPPARRGRAPV